MSKGRIAGALIALFCLLALPSTASAMKFEAPNGSPVTGLGLISRAVTADFNGDGRDDLATATGSTNGGVSIRLAQANGSWTAVSSLDSTTGVYGLASGDITGDGKADLVTTGTGQNGHLIRLWAGNSGGSFDGPYDVPCSTNLHPGGPRSLAIGDVTGDGEPDILFGLTKGEYTISVGTGSTDFDNTITGGTHVSGAPSGPDDRFTGVSIGDYNGDGDPDFALGMSPSTLDDPSLVDIYVMLGDGVGGFTPADGNPVQVAQPVGYEGRIFSMATGNFNGDGRDDLAVSTTSGDPRGLVSQAVGTIQTFVGSATNGLASGTVVAMSDDRPGPVLTGDFDRDNKTDLAWMERIAPDGPSTNQVVVARGNGDGTFSNAAGAPFVFATGAGSTTDLLGGDFNGDHAPDFGSASGNQSEIRLLQNQPDLSADPVAVDFGNLLHGTSDQDRQVQILNSGGPDVKIDEIIPTGDDLYDFNLLGTCHTQTVNALAGCTQQIRFSPNLAPGTYSANLHVPFEGNFEPLDIPLTAKIVAPRVEFDPGSLDFGQLRIGQNKTLSVTATNTGDAALTFMVDASIIGTDASYFVKTSDACSGSTIGPGDTCSVSVKATSDDETGVHDDAVLRLVNDGYDSPTDVALSMTGIDPAITVDPASKNFGPVAVGSSENQTFTITSSGTSNLEFDDFLIVDDTSGDFSIVDNDCPAELEPDETCEVEVGFAPEDDDTEERSAQLQIETNDPVPTKVVELSGTALQAEDSYDVDEIDFGDVPVGTTASKVITMTNTGTTTMSVEGTWIDAPNNHWQSFSIDQDGCSPTDPGSTRDIPVGQSCTYRLNFTPTERGDRNIWTGVRFAYSSGEVAVTGTGVQPEATFDPSSHDFGQATIGASGSRPVYTFNLASTGLDPVTVQSLAIEGPDADSFRLADGVCSAPLPVNEKCQVTVTFDPQGGNPGSRVAVVSAVTDGGVVEAELTGTAARAAKPNYRFRANCPKKGRVGKRIVCSIALTNPLPGALKQVKIAYTGKQGKRKAAVKGAVKIKSVKAGKKVTRKVRIKLNRKKLRRGQPLKFRFKLTAGGKALGARTDKVRLIFKR